MKHRISVLLQSNGNEKKITELTTKIEDKFSRLFELQEDFINEILGNKGLEDISYDYVSSLVLKELKSFDYRLGMRFSDYAKPRILSRWEENETY